LVFVSAWLFGGSALGFGQWIHYPTSGIPRKNMGRQTWPPPKLPDGKPHFSGIWHMALINQYVPETGLFCGPEIGGSPLALDIGRNMPEGLPFKTPGGPNLEEAHGQMAILMCDAARITRPRTSAMPHLTKAIHTPRLLVLPLRSESDVPADLHRWMPATGNPTPSWNGTRRPDGRVTLSWWRPSVPSANIPMDSTFLLWMQIPVKLSAHSEGNPHGIPA
jgi:hypothetical protein